jgi:hypothetical protein
MKRVSIVIVNWNGKKDTVACLDSLKRMNSKGCDLRIIVVDNGSTNDSVAVISRAHPQVRLIETGSNIGFSGGNNIGIKAALATGAGYIWLLNNDTIVQREALSNIRAFDLPSVGIAGSKIYFAAGREYHLDRYTKRDQGRVFWYAGGLIDWANMYASHRGVDEVDVGQFSEMEETPFVTGCSMMVRRAVFDKIGLLDDRFYLYLEDVDFCLRARHHGFRLLYVPTSVVWHIGAGSSGGAGNPLHDYYITRNRLLVGFRYAPIRTKLALLREAFLQLIGTSTIKRSAVIDALTGRFGRRYEPKKVHN